MDVQVIYSPFNWLNLAVASYDTHAHCLTHLSDICDVFCVKRDGRGVERIGNEREYGVRGVGRKGGGRRRSTLSSVSCMCAYFHTQNMQIALRLGRSLDAVKKSGRCN